MSEQRCLIWGEDAEVSAGTGSRLEVHSPRAGGAYAVTLTAERLVKDLKSLETKKRLTCWLVEQRCLGMDCPEIDSNTLNLVMQGRSWSVHERADYLLRFTEFRTEKLGTVIKFFELDNSKNPRSANELLAWTGSIEITEVIALADYCASEGWIEYRKTERAGSFPNTIHEIMLRPPGYARLASINAASSGSTKAFIAMWFDPSMNAARDAIKDAISDAGYDPVRIDDKEYNEKIDDEIIAEIRRSRFVVADFTQGETGARGGVYYEAGFAHGLNIPVIFCCQKETLSKIHFDTRQYNHIAWDDAEDLRLRLSQRISATLGDGPFKKGA
jgi:hypothetical protein